MATASSKGRFSITPTICQVVKATLDSSTHVVVRRRRRRPRISVCRRPAAAAEGCRCCDCDCGGVGGLRYGGLSRPLIDGGVGTAAMPMETD